MPAASTAAGPPRASAAETGKILALMLGASVAQGPILRRPGAVAVAERADVDRHAVRLLQRLRRDHGGGPVLIALPGRKVLLLVTAAQVREVLEGAADPFSPASAEKRAALAHFQPRGVLISHGEARRDRRRFIEAVLETDVPAHHLAPSFVQAAAEEVDGLLAEVAAAGEVGWDEWHAMFWRVVRRVVLGDGARDDTELTDLLDLLRSDANWAFLHRRRRAVRDRFADRLRQHLDRRDPGSLASVLREGPVTGLTDPEGQVPHWLFAYDAAAIASFRALALLAAHQAELGRVRDELGESAAEGVPLLPRLRAAVLESVRLWPTTLVVLREATRDTTVAGHEVPAGTTVVVHSPSMHRDDESLPYADVFAPEVWLDGRARAEWSVVPFSGGPARCPGRDLVLLTTSAVLAAVLRGHDVEQVAGRRLRQGAPLPHTVDHTRLRVAVRSRPDR